MIDITDQDRVRTVRLNRPEAKNAMNEALWHATADALDAAADDSGVAVAILTGTGDAFCAGQDVIEMAKGAAGELEGGLSGFGRLTGALLDFPKPLICAVNGMALGFGVTVLGLSDLAFMSSTARLKCPFTSLGVAPELASSYTFPRLIGRQNASWVLMSSEWISAEEAQEYGLVFEVCAPDDLMGVVMAHARTLASKPINSLIETKRTITAPLLDPIRDARAREDAAFAKLLGGPANIEAMTAFAEKRAPNFDGLDS